MLRDESHRLTDERTNERVVAEHGKPCDRIDCSKDEGQMKQTDRFGQIFPLGLQLSLRMKKILGPDFSKDFIVNSGHRKYLEVS